MSRIGVDKFRFVSPGVQTAEVDLSRRPAEAGDAGPCIIGRFAKGPTMRPTAIRDMQELVKVFGEPVTGLGATDVSRYGTPTAPSYAAYAAMAYLRNSSDITVVRLVGKEYSSASTDGACGYSVGANGAAGQGGAFGLFLIPSGSTLGASSEALTGTLAAVWYVQDSGSVVLSGSMENGASAGNYTVEAQGNSILFPSLGSNAAFKGIAMKNEGTPAAYFDSTGIKATNVIANPSTPDAHNQTIIVAVGGSTVLTITTDDGTAYTATPTLVGTTHTLGISGSLSATQVYAALAHLLNQLDNVSAAANGATSVTITADAAATSTYDITVTGTYITGGHSSSTATAGLAPSHYEADDTVVFDLSPSSDMFIRKVFNTNPTFTNSKVTDNQGTNYKRYWLGASYEDMVSEMFSSGDGTNTFNHKVKVAGGGGAVGAAKEDLFGVIFPLVDATTTLSDFTYEAQPAKSGWIFGQDLSALTASYSPASMPKLFRFVTLEESENVQKQIKISIANIKAGRDGIPGAEYGKFDVVVRKIDDNDRDMQIIETFTGCNLNPQSPGYIGRKIGDQRFVWNDSENRYRIMGSYPNASKYIRVELNAEVQDGALDASLLPFGFYGVPRFSAISLAGGATAISNSDAIGGGEEGMATAGGDATTSVWTTVANGAQHLASSTTGGHLHKYLTASLEFPRHKLVESASVGWLADPKDRYLGLDVLRHESNSVFDDSLHDVLSLKLRAKNKGSGSWDAGTGEEVSNYFTLDDVRPQLNTGLGGVYISGSRAEGKSYTAGCVDSTNGSLAVNTDTSKAGYQKVLDAGYDKFTLPLYGGFEGVDVTEREPLINNRILSESNDSSKRTIRDSYEYYTLRRAIDTISDPEIVDMDMLLMPGIHDDAITDHMINTCEARADALAIIDLTASYTPRHETTGSSETVNAYAANGNIVDTLITELKNERKINSSYVCSYYPWVQVRDTRNGANIWMPPSVVALGAMSYSQAVSALWFAPAGFNRGGLSQGNAGLPVLQVSQRLTKKERDKLYEENVNPIAQFPAEGIVIFGQKTMQQVPSALDRINVRRMLLYMKKRISRMASTVLFDPNIQITWQRFMSKARPFMETIKAGFGLEDFRIVLDSTTTTPDLVDRNVMYAQIWIKPTRAVEFIALDFIITGAGASFDD